MGCPEKSYKYGPFSMFADVRNQYVNKSATITTVFLHYCFWLLVMATICFFSACSGNKNETLRSTEMIATYTRDPVVIDGIFDEQVWQNSQMIRLRNNRSGNEITEVSEQTEVRTCFNDSCLYISFVCYDTDIWGNFSARDQHLWEEEAVEVFIDTDNKPDTYIEIEVSPRNVLFDSYIVDPQNIDIAATKSFDLPGIKTAVFVQGTLEKRNDIDENWNVEIALPFANLDIKENYATHDSSWRINFYRIDRNSKKEAASYAWSPTFGRFHRPDVFGVLRFIKLNSKRQ